MASLKLNDTNFSDTVLKSDKPVLVDFGATWCGPCRVMDPLVDEIAVELAGKAVIGKIDMEESPETSVEYGVRSAPTILIFKGGEVVDQLIGAAGKEKIKAKLLPYL